jgi:hypothetical protein
MSDDDYLIRRGDVTAVLLQHAKYFRDCAQKADAAEALLGVLAAIRALPATLPAAAARFVADLIGKEVMPSEPPEPAEGPRPICWPISGKTWQRSGGKFSTKPVTRQKNWSAK